MPDQFAIAVTVDYELFSNGQGDLSAHILSPTEQLLQTAAALHIPLTFFIEIGEILAFEQAAQSNQTGDAYKQQVQQIGAQIGRMVQLGHDVQLHYHPQWRQAEYTDDGWQLASQSGDLLQYGVETLKENLLAGKHYLESLCQPHQPDYRCHIFRAGGYQLPQDAQLDELLYEIGMQADSSVVPGYYRRTPYSDIDFRALLPFTRPYWHTLDGSLIELPVFARMQSNWAKLNFNRLLTKLFRGQSVFTPQGIVERAGAEQSIGGILHWLQEKQANIWDFTLMDGYQLKSHYRQALRQFAGQGFVPLVMIGHTKELSHLRALTKLHRVTQHHSHTNWMTLTQIVETIQAQEGSA